MLAHRHNRNDEYLQNPLVSFDTVRRPMYKYSKQAQDDFFAQSAYAFLFGWFVKSRAGQEFAAARFAENDDERHSERMFKEIDMLGAEAQKKLMSAAASQHS